MADKKQEERDERTPAQKVADEQYERAREAAGGQAGKSSK